NLQRQSVRSEISQNCRRVQYYLFSLMRSPEKRHRGFSLRASISCFSKESNFPNQTSTCLLLQLACLVPWDMQVGVERMERCPSIELFCPEPSTNRSCVGDASIVQRRRTSTPNDELDVIHPLLCRGKTRHGCHPPTALRKWPAHLPRKRTFVLSPCDREMARVPWLHLKAIHSPHSPYKYGAHICSNQFHGLHVGKETKSTHH